MVWNGTSQASGAGSNEATGLPYRGTILGLLSEPSAFKLTVNSVDFTRPDGSIDLDIEVMEGGMNVDNMVLRMAIIEDNVPYESDMHHDVTRDMIADVPITVSDMGEIQNVVRTFPVNATWVEANLDIIAFLQDDSDRKVHASTSTKPTPDYSMRYYALGELSRIGPSSGFNYFDYFRIYNMGTQTDTFTVDAIGDWPAGWSGGICDETICFGYSYSVELAPGEYKDLHMLVHPVSPGSISLEVQLGQTMVVPDFPRAITYNYITDDVDVLIVDDDGAGAFEQYAKTALTGSPYTFGVWDRLTTGLDAVALSNFPVVVWGTGFHFPTIDAADQAALADYLESGGALFMTGQDIGWELVSEGLGAQWYRDYLHANWIADDTNDYTLDGVPGDPISDGLNLVIQGGDGADNQDYPDDIDPWDDFASVIWTYSSTKNGGIRAETATYKVVYLGFGFEAIDNPIDRADVLTRSIDWLLTPPTGSGWLSSDDPLRLAKAGPRIAMSWGDSCMAGDTDFNLYKGTIGDWDSHELMLCDVGANSYMFLPMAGDEYYLVVSEGPTFEGSYGTSSDYVERPQGAGACRPQLVGECSE